MRIWEGETLVADTGDIWDNDQGSLKGGRLGVYCDSQEDITWSALSYRSVLSVWCESFLIMKSLFSDVLELESDLFLFYLHVMILSV